MRNKLISTTLLLFAALLMLPAVTRAQFTDSIQYFRFHDQRGINVFETPKTNTVQFNGLKLRFGAGFTQQFQNLKSKNNDANYNVGTQPNRLYPIAPGFMTAQANLFMDVQLADGIRVEVTTYLSSRHHNEAWVKGGYLQFDKLPFKGKFWNDIMKVTTIKLGHMEINYGDQHFRRPDGGHTIQSPFMEGNIMDAFTTEIGGEVYVQKYGFTGMLGLTGGTIKGNIDSAYAVPIDSNTRRNPSVYFKLAYDKQINENIRVRLSGSFYSNTSQANNGLTLYGGDRTGSNYQNVIEKGAPGALPSATAIAFSGRFNPGFSKKVNAFMLNGFLKAYGFEFFGTYETANGRAKTDSFTRKATQYAVEGVYRFGFGGKKDNLYLGLRYNVVKAQLATTTFNSTVNPYYSAGDYIKYNKDVQVDRFAIAAGWFISKNILLKGEYVIQNYRDFPSMGIKRTTGVPTATVLGDYRAGAKFNGYVIEAVVGF